MLYYTPPEDIFFEEMKQAALDVWDTYEPPYSTSKIDRVKNMENIEDNFMYIFAMFDTYNQRKVFAKLSEGARLEVIKRLNEQII